MRRQIVKPAEAAAERANLPNVSAEAYADTGKSDELSADTYKDRLLKHIPAETVTVYLTADGLIRSTDPSNLTLWLWLIFGVCLAGTPLYLWRLQGVTSPLQLGVSFLSFGVWVFALGGPFARYSWYEAGVASAILVLFTFLVPFLFGKSTQQ